MDLEFLLETLKNPVVRRDCDALKRFADYVSEAKTIQQKCDRLREMYAFAKTLTMEKHYEGENRRLFEIGGLIIENATESVPYEPCLDVMKIELPEESIEPNGKEIEDVLDFIVGQVRQTVAINLHSKQGVKPFYEYDLTDMCQELSFIVYDLAKILFDIRTKVHFLYPGYLMDRSLYEFKGGGEHVFVTLEVNGRRFLVDCTYSQFFTQKRCVIEKTGIIKVRNCFPGFFAMQDENRLRVARDILSKGWVELEGDVLKHYLDSFTLSFRNGLYYEKTGDFSYTTPYTVEDYERFLNQDDNQLEHESEELLGYQYRPLHNPKMPFFKK